jgi:hypothetical protein
VIAAKPRAATHQQRRRVPDVMERAAQELDVLTARDISRQRVGDDVGAQQPGSFGRGRLLEILEEGRHALTRGFR